MLWSRNNVLLILLLTCMAGHLHAQPPRQINLATVNTVKLWSSYDRQERTVERSSKMTLLVLLSPECPMSVNYTRTLNQLQEKFREQLVVTGVIPGRTVKDDAVMKFANDYRLSFSLLVDRELLMVKMLKGEVTPEAFLFNEEGDLVYSGAIDNWLTELGKKKAKPDLFFLQDAVQNSINGSPLTVRYIKAQGCLVNDY